MGSEEQTVWRGSPSQILNLWIFVLCALTCWAIVPVFIAAFFWLRTRCHVYELTTERFREAQGVFSRTTHELELYRVKDTVLVEPFLLRIFGLANIELRTSDMTTPESVIRAVRGAAGIRDMLRENVERMREWKRVGEIDFKAGGPA